MAKTIKPNLVFTELNTYPNLPDGKSWSTILLDLGGSKYITGLGATAIDAVNEALKQWHDLQS